MAFSDFAYATPLVEFYTLFRIKTQDKINLEINKKRESSIDLNIHNFIPFSAELICLPRSALGAGSPRESPRRSVLKPFPVTGAAAEGLAAAVVGFEVGMGAEGVDGFTAIDFETTGLLNQE